MSTKPYFAHPSTGFHDLLLIADPAEYYAQKIRGDRPASENWGTLGQAYHALTLEGEAAMLNDFAVIPPEYITESGRASTSKAAKQWAESIAPRETLSPSELDLCKGIARAVRAHHNAGLILKQGMPEVERYWVDRATGISCKAMVDWLGPDCIADLKGCQDLDTFPEDCAKYHYVDQCTWYGDAFERPKRYLIAVEKQRPHRVGVWIIGHNATNWARIRNLNRLDKLKDCLARDDWRSAYHDLRTIETDPSTSYMDAA